MNDSRRTTAYSGPPRPGRALRGAAAATGLAALLTACASASGIPGCYRFEEAVDAPRLGLPWGIELREEPLVGWPALAEAHTAFTWLSEQERAGHPFGYWVPVEGDSIRTGYPGGGGFDLVLAPENGDLAGHGRAVGDAIPPGDPGGPRPTIPVLARRVTCPTP